MFSSCPASSHRHIPLLSGTWNGLTVFVQAAGCSRLLCIGSSHMYGEGSESSSVGKDLLFWQISWKLSRVPGLSCVFCCCWNISADRSVLSALQSVVSTWCIWGSDFEKRYWNAPVSICFLFPFWHKAMGFLGWSISRLLPEQPSPQHASLSISPALWQSSPLPQPCPLFVKRLSLLHAQSLWDIVLSAGTGTSPDSPPNCIVSFFFRHNAPFWKVRTWSEKRTFEGYANGCNSCNIRRLWRIYPEWPRDIYKVLPKAISEGWKEKRVIIKLVISDGFKNKHKKFLLFMVKGKVQNPDLFWTFPPIS